MALTLKKPEGGDFQMAPQGTHIARCYMVVDLGMQLTNFGSKHKIHVSWELPSELMEDGRPFVVGKEYTASLHEESNLTADLTAWRGRAFTEEELNGFDVEKVVGVPCMITVIHATSKKGKTYANVKSVTAIPKGSVCPPAVNPPVKFSLEKPDEAMFALIPEWIQKKVNRGGSTATPESANKPAFDDDIPF